MLRLNSGWNKIVLNQNAPCKHDSCKVLTLVSRVSTPIVCFKSLHKMNLKLIKFYVNSLTLPIKMLSWIKLHMTFYKREFSYLSENFLFFLLPRNVLDMSGIKEYDAWI